MPSGDVNLRVARSNVLTEALHTLSLVEHRLYLLAASLVQREHQALPAISVHVVDFKRVYGYRPSNNGVGSQLAEAARTLRSAVVTLHAETDQEQEVSLFDHVAFVSGAEAEDGLARVDLRFNDSLAPHFLELRGRFCVLTIKDIAGLSSRHALRLAELVAAWDRGRPRVDRRLPLRTLASLFGVPYVDWATLRRRALAPAIDQLSTNSLTRVTFTPYRRHRHIREVRLTVERVVQPIFGMARKAGPSRAEVLAQQYGASPVALAGLRELGEQTALEVVTRAVRSIEKLANGPSPVKNRGGYIATAIRHEIDQQAVPGGGAGVAPARPAEAVPEADVRSSADTSATDVRFEAQLAERLIDEFEQARRTFAEEAFASLTSEQAHVVEAEAHRRLEALPSSDTIPAERSRSMLQSYRYAAMENRSLISFKGELESVSAYAKAWSPLDTLGSSDRATTVVCLAQDLWLAGNPAGGGRSPRLRAGGKPMPRLEGAERLVAHEGSPLQQ